jgi:hypothetical protein
MNMDISKKKNISIIMVMVLSTTIFAAMIVHADSQTTISFGDKTIPQGSTKNVGLLISNVTHLGSFDIKISWNPKIINIVSVSENDDFKVASYINNNEGYVNLTVYRTVNVTGSVQPAILKVKAIGLVGESCILRINSSQLLTADPSPHEISHTRDNGLIEVGEPTSSGPSPGNPTPASENTPPVCNASLSETTGFVGETIMFDGSGSYDTDGMITSYTWDFGDEETGMGMTTSHQYDQPGAYEVSLTIKDDDGASSSDIITVVIQASANTPPTTPTITGPSTGSQNQSYHFTFDASDKDGDNLRFIITWGDDTSNTTEFSDENESVQVSHQWTDAGRFTITAQADDNKTVSSKSAHVILIDAKEIVIDDELVGVITDTNGDTIYDRFDGKADQISYQEDTDQYLLDTDGDSKWDYTYNVENDELSSYVEKQDDQPTSDISYLLIIGIIIVLVIIGIGIYLNKSKQQKK